MLVIYRDGVRVGEAAVSGKSWVFQDDGVKLGDHVYIAKIESAAAVQAASGSFSLAVAPESRFGMSGSDRVEGTSGADKIWGVPAGGTSLGRGTIDTLVGNGGTDIFVLGDDRGVFYDDGKSKSSGTADYALITGFGSDDALQLVGSARDYLFSKTTLQGVTGLGIYHDTNSNGFFDSRDELIALLAGVDTISQDQLLFV
jgi:Ca2+-binding RTX toxin-like protein